MNKPIKILYLIVDAAPYGSNIALLNLFEMLVPKGLEPIVVMSGSGGISEILKKRGIPQYQVKYFYSVYPRLNSFRNIMFFIPIFVRTILYNFFAVKKLTRIARNLKVDLIHTNIGPLHIGYHVAKRLGIPHAWHIREYQDLYIGYHPLFSRNGFIKKLNGQNCFPIAITKGLFDHYSMKKNAVVIYDGVMEASRTQFIQEKMKYFLFVGRIEKEKGIKELILVFKEFAKYNNDYKLIIAGDGAKKFKSKISQMVIEAGIEERIVFLGFRSDINDLMARAMALIVPSKHEGFGFTTVEALFNGCLVLGMNSGGTKEIIELDKIGILFNDKNELLIEMKEVVKNGIEQYFPVIKKAIKVAANKYSCEKNAEDILNLYRRLLSE